MFKNFIELHTTNNRLIMFNMRRVLTVEPSVDGCYIRLNEGTMLNVKETYKELKQLLINNENGNSNSSNDGWHDLRKNPDDLPKELKTVNITWVNHEPEAYYKDIKDKPFSDASAIYYKGKWWWWSVLCEDLLAEYGKSSGDEMAEAIEVIAWKEIEPYEVGK